MKKKKSILEVLAIFSPGEKWLWGLSGAAIVLSFLIFDRANYLTLVTSLIGVTSLLFNAKGHPFGQLLMIVFSLLYGIISFAFAYYGEMLTYMGMTMPMAVAAYISWRKNPFAEGKTEVRVNAIRPGEHLLMWALTAVVTVLFYFVLAWFDTANLLPSTISVTTSFLAVYLTFRRSPYYAIGYAANDVVLIVLWSMAATENRAYLSVVVCFMAFLVNDIYGFLNWKQMEKRQSLTV